MAGEYSKSLSRNRLNVTSPSLDYENHRNYTPDIMTYAGLTLAVGGADGQYKAIGRIQSFQRDAMTRTLTQKRELNKDTFGRPIETVPGVADGYTMSLERLEIWEQEFEIALGFPFVFSDLMDQRWSVDIFEYRYKGDTLYRLWKYPNCWISSLSDGQPSSDGDGIYQASASMTFLPRLRIV